MRCYDCPSFPADSMPDGWKPRETCCLTVPIGDLLKQERAEKRQRELDENGRVMNRKARRRMEKISR